MTILIIILLIIAAIVVIILIAAAASSSTYTISRDVVIARPKDTVFDFVRHLRNQEQYSKWVMLDPNSRKTFTGTDGTVGFIYAWDSDNKQVGQGEQEIISINNGVLNSQVRFIKPFEGKLDATFTATEVPGGTNLNWTINGERNLMMRVFHLLLNLPKTLGNDMAESLNNLKKVLEQ